MLLNEEGHEFIYRPDHDPRDEDDEFFRRFGDEEIDYLTITSSSDDDDDDGDEDDDDSDSCVEDEIYNNVIRFPRIHLILNRVNLPEETPRVTDENDANIGDDSDLPRVGFARGLEPDYIEGATNDENGKLWFLIKWKDSELADLMDSTIIYRKCPQLAIHFFEQRLSYSHD